MDLMTAWNWEAYGLQVIEQAVERLKKNEESCELVSVISP